MVKKEIVLTSRQHQRSIGVDFRFIADGRPKPVVLFVHGFKGFKDAMHFNALADTIATAGSVYVKMNLSHNGVTPEHPLDFVDLEAFANNNFSIEMDDIDVVLDYIQNQGLDIPRHEINIDEIYLIGHSRGGAVSILKACEDPRIKKLVTWAAVPDLGAFWTKDFLASWKQNRVVYIKNARTLQDMPLNYQIVEDFEANSERFNIGSQLTKLNIPFMAIHGSEDETVAVESLLMFKSFYPEVIRKKIEGAGHTFGGKHPWTEPSLPDHSQQLAEQTIDFLIAKE
ncbi:MAG: dienelactone hydrolase [Reichenbachiella sp.]|uniref:alpha/beta hydrolase family protein n=1 Tax=Reichenbachiella sp. TaxID=2184521 RepID=UPI003263336A